MGSSIKIMIVDDEPSIRDSLKRFLDDYDFTVSTAESAEDALAQLDQSQHDIVIVDIRLPRMDGDTLILEAHTRQPSLRFLVYTGSVEYKVPPELTQIGVHSEHVFLKPIFDLSVFVDAIQDLLAS